MLSDRCLSLSVLPVTFVYCGQTVGWIKMKLGTKVGLVPGHTVLDGDPVPPPQFSAHICCGQTAGRIKMPLGREVGLGPSDILLDGTQLPSQKRRHNPLIFGPCLLLPNGWTDQDATWYEGRPRPRPHCVTRGPSSPHPKRGTATSPNFWPMSIVAERSPILVTAEQLFANIYTIT